MSKRIMCNKFSFEKFGSSCCQEPFAYSICQKHLVKVFGKTIVPLCCVPFEKKHLIKKCYQI